MEKRLRLTHVGTGPHGFPLKLVEEITTQEIMRVESTDPRELVRELKLTAGGVLGVEVVGELPAAPDRPLPGWDPIADLLEGSAPDGEEKGQ